MTFGEVTPLPLKSLIVVCVVLLSEGFSLTMLFPFVGRMVLVLRAGGEDKVDTSGDAEKDNGFYVGIIASSYSLAQFVSGFAWGRVADRWGRRAVILFGLCGNIVAIVSFGLSTTLAWAVASRAFNGLVNGNIGAAKALLADLTDDTNAGKAFSVLGITWALGLSMGPALGGFLAEPAESFPGTFSREGLFGRYPFLLPCLFSAAVSLFGLLFGFAFLRDPRREMHKEKERRRKERAEKKRGRGGDTSGLETIGGGGGSAGNGDLFGAGEGGQHRDRSMEGGDVGKPPRRKRFGRRKGFARLGSGPAPSPDIVGESVVVVGLDGRRENEGLSDDGDGNDDAGIGGDNRFHVSAGGLTARRPSAASSPTLPRRGSSFHSGWSGRNNNNTNNGSNVSNTGNQNDTGDCNNNFSTGNSQHRGAGPRNGQCVDSDVDVVSTVHWENEAAERRSVSDASDSGAGGTDTDNDDDDDDSDDFSVEEGESLIGSKRVRSKKNRGNRDASLVGSGLQTPVLSPTAASDLIGDGQEIELLLIDDGHETTAPVVAGDPHHNDGDDDGDEAAKDPTVMDMFRDPIIRRVALAYALLGLAHVMMDEVLSLMMVTTVHAGGLGLSLRYISLVLVTGGICIGLFQLCFFARVAARLGYVSTFRMGLAVMTVTYPLWYLLNLSVHHRVPMWLMLFALVITRNIAAVLSFTSCNVLVNNSSTSADCLGAVNGFAQSCVALTRAFGPFTGGVIYATSLKSTLPFPLDKFVMFATLAFLTGAAWRTAAGIPASLNKRRYAGGGSQPSSAALHAGGE